MSLATDTIFIRALQSNRNLMALISDGSGQPRLYGTAIPMPEEDADNVPVPYIIVTFDGLTNDNTTKDDPYEGDEDSVNIGIEVTARDLDELHGLTQMVRDTILSYMHENETDVDDYTFSAQAIMYDADKPCWFQVLNYLCDTKRDIHDEDQGSEL